MRSPYEILVELESTNSRNDKLAVLQGLDEKETEAFKLITKLTYDPTIDYYVREFIENNTMEEGEMGIVPLFDALKGLEYIIAARVFTGNMAKAWIEEHYSMLSKDNAEVFKRILKRDLRCGVSTATINKVWPDHIYVHPYMRCSGFSDKSLKNIKFPCISQTKMDGLYCDIVIEEDKVTYMSRNGATILLNTPETDKILKEKLAGRVLQGEMVAKEENSEELMDRSRSNGYLNSNNIDPNRVVFFAWDMIELDDFRAKETKINYKIRWSRLNNAIRGLQNIQLVDSRECLTKDDIIDHFRENREKGEEGTIIKDYSGTWKPGTSKHQIKVKVVFDCEMKMVGYKEGNGKYVGMLGGIQFESSDGLISVSVGGGYSDQQREEYWDEDFLKEMIEAGGIATIRANDITIDENGKSLFLPRFVEFRTDKDEADSFEKIEKQIAEFVNALDLIK